MQLYIRDILETATDINQLMHASAHVLKLLSADASGPMAHHLRLLAGVAEMTSDKARLILEAAKYGHMDHGEN